MMNSRRTTTASSVSRNSIDLQHLFFEHQEQQAATTTAAHQQQQQQLHEICLKGPLHLVKDILESQRNNDSSILLQEMDNDDWTALHHAVQGGNLDIIRYLVDERGADIESITETDEGLDALNLAIIDGHLHVVQYIAEYSEGGKLMLHERNDSGLTPLLVAALEGQSHILQYLVEEQNVDATIVDEDGWSALHYAALAGDLESVQYLVTHYYNQQQKVSGTKSIEQILNAREVDGWTPLHCAANKGYLSIVKCLLECCFDSTNSIVVNRNALLYEVGQNALHLAVSEGHLEVVQYLIERHGYDMMQPSSEGKTPLHLACIFGQVHVVQYLVEGATRYESMSRSERCDARHSLLFGSTACNGETPYDSAVSVAIKEQGGKYYRHDDHEAIIQYLKSFMAPLAVGQQNKNGTSNELAVKLNPNLAREQQELSEGICSLVQNSPVQEVTFHILGYLCLSDVRL